MTKKKVPRQEVNERCLWAQHPSSGSSLSVFLSNAHDVTERQRSEMTSFTFSRKMEEIGKWCKHFYYSFSEGRIVYVYFFFVVVNLYGY